MSIHTSKDGFAEYLYPASGAVGAHLLDFDIDGFALKSSHKDWLDLSAIRHVKGRPELDWSVYVDASASYTGGMQYNTALSQKRADEVGNYLVTRLPSKNLFIETKAWGYTKIALSGKKPYGVEDPRDRLVTAVVQPKAKPKPPFPPPPKKLLQTGSSMISGVKAGGFLDLLTIVKKALARPTDWKFDTTGGFEASIGDISVGAGNFYLKWKDEPTRYKLEHSSVSLNFGLFGSPVNLSISNSEAPGGGVGKIFYLPGHSELVLKDFPGPFVILSGCYSYGLGATASLVFLGTSGALTASISYLTLNPALLIPALLMFKAVGILGGATASGPGASVGGGRGHITAAYAG